MANKMSRHPVDIFLNVRLQIVKRLRIFPVKPSINVNRQPYKKNWVVSAIEFESKINKDQVEK